MPTGFQAFKEDGSLLFDADLIQYGLIKSGYLTQTEWWYWWHYRSEGLDPNDPNSWARETIGHSPIWTISVDGATAPICFLAGDNVSVGSSKSGTTTTFYFASVRNNPKVYIFDLMQDLGGRTGMQIFNASGTLTFTTDMPGLNIINTITAPAPTGGTSWNGNVYYASVYGSGSTNEKISYYVSQSREQGRNWDHSYSPVQDKNGADEVAVRLTFSRAFGHVNRGSSVSAMDGCTGGTSPRFMAVMSATSLNGFTTEGPAWVDIPTSRYPVMQMIDTSHYPFPFR
jgi:hypothetical protein